MAFDYGSLDLGLKNPFKLEGKITAIRGGIQLLIGLYLLITAASSVKSNPTEGWILMAFGVFLVTTAIASVSKGIYATMRYFVGRNHPTSLAANYSPSETDTARQEAPYVAYTAENLEEMLVGRKNITFVEPQGFLARLLHSLFPKLLFLPFPIRNMAQQIAAAWVKTLVTLLTYGIVAFVTLAGFAGKVGELIFPIYSVIVVLILLQSWRKAAKPISRRAEKSIESIDSEKLGSVITKALIVPVILGLSLGWLMQKLQISVTQVNLWLNRVPDFNPGLYIVSILLLALVASGIILFLLRIRLQKVNPATEVSELRENWQENVHPNEIFINLDNLVMANRRYKEVPNRVYRALDPQLRQQISGKGDFYGELIQEIQPQFKPTESIKGFSLFRNIALFTGNSLLLVVSILTLWQANAIVEFYQHLNLSAFENTGQFLNQFSRHSLLNTLSLVFHIALIQYLIASFGKMLCHSAHLFFSEMQFESLLIYFKCEGTFTESKISTGTGIYDSTRSENTLVRSSITPWVIASRLVTTTFASTGMNNLEHPRYIMEMHKADQDLADIRKDIISFLKDRESIAVVTSERDLGNASQIHQLNQQTRAMPKVNSPIVSQDAEAKAYLKKEEALGNSQVSTDANNPTP